MRKTWTGPK